MNAKLFILPFAIFPCTLLANEMDTLSVRKLNEVVVVSTPKEHDALRHQPLSSTSIGEGQLSQKGINNIKDLSAHIPGLFIPRYGSRLTSSIYLRGVGSRIGTPAIGMYVDDIPLANMSSMDQDLSDAERIDILRGPQGTLFGRNTIGGLIRVYTKNPMSYQGTDLLLGGATYNNYRARVTHYHRPSDRFAFSAGVGYEHLGGFYKNQALGGKRADISDDISARWRGIFIPSDKVRLDLSARYQWTKQGGYPYAAAQGDDAGEVAYNRESSYLRHLLTLGLNAEHDLGRVMMTSTTGFQFLKDEMFMDQDFSRQDLYSLQQMQKSKTISEEIAVKSKGTSRWKWTSGISFQHQWLNTNAPVTFYQEGIDWLSSIINRSLPDLTAQGMGPMSITLKNSILPMGGVFDTPTLNAGLFHQSTIEIVKNLSLTAGVRLDYEHYKMTYDAPGSVDYDFAIRSANPRNSITLNDRNITPSFLGKTSNHDWHVLPKASLKYNISKAVSIYASVCRGYRSGGYNVQMFSDLLQTEMRRDMMSDIEAGAEAYLKNLFARMLSIPGFNPQSHINMIMGRIHSNMPTIQSPDVAEAAYYKPETAWNYEIGSHLDLFNGRLKADLAAFWIDTKDLQISQMAESGMGRVTVNADRSRSVGMEASFQAFVTDNLSINASYGYTNAQLRHTGCFVPFTPRHTVSVGVLHVWQTKGWFQHVSLYTGYKGAGRIYWTRENDLSQPFYALLDARLTVSHDILELALWGNNLTCTDYNAFSFATRGQVFSQRGTPTQVGIDCRLKF